MHDLYVNVNSDADIKIDLQWMFVKQDPDAVYSPTDNHIVLMTLN